MKKILCSAICLALVAVIILTGGHIQATAKQFDHFTAKSYIVMDESGNILAEKNAEAKVEVASICKLMTTLIVLEHIDNGSLTLDEKFVASSYACDAEGSQAFLDGGSEYTIKDLLKSVIVASANDSAIVLAEGVAGSESSFVEMMNVRACQLGMNSTKYANSTGLPASEQYSTAKDTAIILNEVSKYDLFQKDCNIWMDKFVHPSGRETELVNTNRLIKYYTYCKTGKTGFTDEAGYCLSSISVKDNLKIICVVLGSDSSANRFKESIELYNYAYANFTNQLVLSKADKIDNSTAVLSGKQNTIELAVSQDFYLTQAKNNKKDFLINYNLPKEVKAPLSEGDIVGSASVIVDGFVVAEVDVISLTTVEKQNYNDVINKIINEFSLIN